MTTPEPRPMRRDPIEAAAIASATGALVAMPVAMWLANRSAALCLCLAALACLVALWRRRWPATAWMKQAVMRAPWLPLAAFCIWGLVSIGWSHRPLASLAMWGEAVLPLVAGVVVAAAWPTARPAWALPALLVSILLAAGLTIGELRLGTGWRAAMGLRPNTFVFNRTLITLLMLAIPLFGALIWRGKWLAAAALGLTLGAALLLSESGAAVLGFAVALMAGIASFVLPRLALALAAMGMVALLAFAPVKGEIADDFLPPSVHNELQGSHSRDRVDIWLSFGDAIREQPWLGAGFGTSASFAEAPVAQKVQPSRRTLLAVGHPHGADVQIWAETGFVGAALLLWAGLGLIARLARQGELGQGELQPIDRAHVTVAVALLAGALAIAIVGHGAWQGWWIATLAAAALWMRALMGEPKGHGQ